MKTNRTTLLILVCALLVAALEAAQTYVTLLKTASPHTEWPGYQASGSMPDVFSEGQTGMWFTAYANAFVYEATNSVLDVRIAPLP